MQAVVLGWMHALQVRALNTYGGQDFGSRTSLWKCGTKRRLMKRTQIDFVCVSGETLLPKGAYPPWDHFRCCAFVVVCCFFSIFVFNRLVNCLEFIGPCFLGDRVFMCLKNLLIFLGIFPGPD